MLEILPYVSALLGWIYTLCWSASFYPQPLLNYRRKTTSGSTVDFPFINVLGFLAYFTSNVAFVYSPIVRSQYAERNHGLETTVRFNDIVFALHGLIMSLITLSQYLFGRSLWSFAPSSGTRPSRFILGVAAGCVCAVLFVCQLVAFSPRRRDPMSDWSELDVVYAVGYVKLIITLIKYTPQVLVNFRNKSTSGWSIWQILLDFAGGVLSVAQQGIDSWLQRDWSGITGNPVKFALGNVSVCYDLVFMLQHYVLYRRRDAGGSKPSGPSEDDRLLSDEERRLD